MFLRQIMQRILLWTFDYIDNHLTGSAKLHWPKGEGSFGTKCLMKYSPAQPPMFTIRVKSKVTIMAIPEST